MIKDKVLAKLKKQSLETCNLADYNKVAELIEKQVEKGIAKYGGPLDEKNLSLKELFTHAEEEGVDLMFYFTNICDKVETLCDGENLKGFFNKFSENISKVLMDLIFLERVLMVDHEEFTKILLKGTDFFLNLENLAGDKKKNE